MQSLDVTCVPQWVQANGWWFPLSIDANCPHCTGAINLRLSQPGYDPQRKTMAGSGSCPRCGGSVHVWAVEPTPAGEQQPSCAGLLMYPPQRQQREPVEGTNLLPPKLATAYRQALSVYNARLWNVTASCCRQTLEALARHLLPAYEIQDALSQNVKRLSTSVELKRPVADMAFTIREGGKLSNYFELSAEPDERTARVMLDITEYLLQYLCTLPRLSEEMKKYVEHSAIGEDVRRAG